MTGSLPLAHARINSIPHGLLAVRARPAAQRPRPGDMGASAQRLALSLSGGIVDFVEALRGWRFVVFDVKRHAEHPLLAGERQMLSLTQLLEWRWDGRLPQRP